MLLHDDRQLSVVRHGWKLIFLISCVSILLLAACRSWASPVSAEYTLKAALIFKLTRFVTWPQDKDVRDDGHFGICVLGRDDFGSTLDALAGHTVNGTPIVIHRFSQSDTIADNCQMVFISDSKRAFLKPIIRNLDDRPVLTIGDFRHFAQQGGMIQFVRNNSKIGFVINLKQAINAGLKIAAPLLELATIVEDIPKERVR